MRHASSHRHTTPCTSGHKQRNDRNAWNEVARLLVSPTSFHAYSTAYSHAYTNPSTIFRGLVVGTAHLTSTIPSTFALDKPIYSAIVCLITLATVLLALARFLPKGDTPTPKDQYVAVALEETRYNNAPRDHSRDRTEHVAQPTNLRRLRALFLVLVLAICLRVELVRQIILNVQCARPTWEPILPLALAFWDYATLRRRRRHDVEVDEQTSTMYEIWECRIMNSPYRYLAAVAITCFGSLGAMRALGSSPSTHICAASLPYSWSIPYAQHTGTALDALIVLCISGLMYSEDEYTSRGPSTRFSAIGWVCLVGYLTPNNHIA